MPKKARVKPESSFSYVDKLTGKERRFEARKDEVVATFATDVTDEAARHTMMGAAMAVSQGLNLERGFAVFQVGADHDVATAAHALAAQPAVANILPAMTDGEGLTRYFLPDEFTVQFKPNVKKSDAARIIEERGCAIVAEQRTPGYYTLAVPEGKGLFEMIRAFSDLDEVAFAEPSEAGFNDALAYLPNDPDFPKLWGLHNTGQAVNGSAGSSDADIDAAEAWDIARGDPAVVVAVIDTGCDLNHPDLQANLLARGSEDWDFADGADPSPDDVDGHGTHVAGTAAAADNTGGVIGVAPRCRVMPLRVNLTSGMNQNRADAINYVAAQAAAHPDRRYVINCSWRMSGDHAGVRNAIMNAVASNVVVVFAAGNANANIDVTPQYPAVYPEAIAVAATDQNDKRASFSNYGGKVDVSAPGVNIYSTYPDDAYAFLDGTSMASPHVAGLAALVWSRNRTLTNQQVRQIIETTCDSIDAKNPGFVGKLGKGRINAFKALGATPAPPIQFSLVRRFKFPQKNNGSSSGLAYARKIRIGSTYRSALLFLTQRPGSERIYYLHPLSGAVMGSVDPVANETLGCLEWDGAGIRGANVTVGAGSINTIHPATGAHLASLPVPPGRGEGLAYDGTHFYYSVINRIYVIRATTGTIVRAFPPPGGPCRSLAYGSGHLFSGNSAGGVITVFNATTLAIRGTIPPPGSGPEQIEGLAFNEATHELFCANQSENLIYVGKVTL